MTQDTSKSGTKLEIDAVPQHPRFSRYYERMSRGGGTMVRLMEPLREEIVGQAHGVVLELGAGNGLNFAYYRPERVERVVAVEPDSTMQQFAQKRLVDAVIPITLTQAAVEHLPFPDAMFDSVVATLVWCSVLEPVAGLHEVARVLKPGGALLMVEHVRAQGRISAGIQDMLVPLTTNFAGNCHWNGEL